MTTTRRSRPRLRIAAAVAAVLLTAGCGSNIDPNTLAGTAAGGANGGGAVGVEGTLPGDVAGIQDGIGGTDPGAAGGGGTSGGGTSGGSGSGGSTSGGTSSGGSTSGGSTSGGSTSGGSTSGGSNSGGSSSGGSNSGGNSGGSGGGSTGGTTGKGDNAADGGVAKVSCAGFKNGPGITDDVIKLANISDIGGPVPGIFESSQEATRAYAAYFNSSSDICGRKLEVSLLDSRADAGADQQAATKACSEAFATVGSMSAFDSGGAATTASCGMPDIRSTIVNPQRRDCKTCFAAQALNPGMGISSLPKFMAKTFPSVKDGGAFLYINAGAAPVNAKSMASVFDQNGIPNVYEQGIGVSEFNYAPYVQQMKSKGVKLVSYMGPYQNAVKLKQAMKQQGFQPDIFLLDATAYDPGYVKQVGGDGDGTFVFMNNDLFSSDNPEMKLYLAWLQQVKPGATPTFYGLYSWSATRLFVEQSLKLGGKLNRASLVQALSGVKDWTGNGIHAPQAVGAKSTSGCTRVIKLSGGSWSQVSSGQYMCGPLTAAK